MSNGWLDTTGTEFGEVDNPDNPNNTKASWDTTEWNKGAWGDDISGWHNQGVALPNAPRGTRVEVRNPETGATTVAEVKDKGPGQSTGAGIDLLPGTGSAIGLPTNYKGPLQYKILGGGMVDEPQDTGDKTQVGTLPEHLDLSNWDKPHNEPAQAQGTVEAPPVSKSLIQEFYDRNPATTDSQQAVLNEMHKAYAPDMPDEQFNEAATTPGGIDIIKEWKERTKSPIEQIRDSHPEWAAYNDDKLMQTLYSEWGKNGQLDTGKLSYDEFMWRMKPPTDAANQTARFIDETISEFLPKSQATALWAMSGTEQHALDNAEPTIREILAKAYSPDTDLDQLFKAYQGMNPQQRRQEFAKAWASMKQGGSDSARLFDQLNTTFETIDKQSQIQESVNWMKKSLGQLDQPGPNQLPANQEKWAQTIAGLPSQAVLAIAPGFREMGLFGTLYAENKAAIEKNNPQMGNAEVAQKAEAATWWSFPGNELLTLSFLRGGVAIQGTILNRLKALGVDLGQEAAGGAAVGGSNQVFTNIAAGRDPMDGVFESAGTMATLGLGGRALGLTVEGLARAMKHVPEIRQAVNISSDIVGASPEEANKIVRGDPTAEVNQKATRNSIDLILSATQQRQEERRIMAGRITESQAQAEDIDPARQRQQEKDILSGRQPKTRGYQPAPDIVPEEKLKEPETRRFVPSTEWQDVPDDMALPPGGDYRVNISTGARQAKWNKPPGPETVVDIRVGKVPKTHSAKPTLKDRVYQAYTKLRQEQGGLSAVSLGKLASEAGISVKELHQVLQEGHFDQAFSSSSLPETQWSEHEKAGQLQIGEPGIHNPPKTAITIYGDAETQVPEKTPAEEAREKAVNARNNGDMKAAEKHINEMTTLLADPDKKEHHKAVADGLKAVTRSGSKAKVSNVEDYFGLNDAPPRVKRGESGAAANPLGGKKKSTAGGMNEKQWKRLMGNLELDDTPENRAQVLKDLEEQEEIDRQGQAPAAMHEAVKPKESYVGSTKTGYQKHLEHTGLEDTPENRANYQKWKGETEKEAGPEGAEEAEMFSGGNPIPFIRKGAQWFRNTEQFKKSFDAVSRTLAPQRRGQSAKDTAALTIGVSARVKMGILLGLKAIAEDLDLNSLFHDAYRSDRRDAKWRQYSDQQIAAMQSVKEKGGTLPDPLANKLFDFTRECYDWLESIGRKNGIEFGHLSNYFHHAFKNPEGEIQNVLKDWEAKFGKQAFQKTRHYPTLADAIAAGLVPKTYSPERNLMAYAAAMTTAVRQVQTLKSMAGEYLAIPTTEVKEQGLTKQPGWSLYSTPDGKSYYVRNDAAGVLANAFDLHSIYDTMAGPFTGFARAFKGVTGIKLSWSVFHPVHIAGIAAAETLTTAMQRGIQGTGTAKDVMEAVKAAATFGVGPMVDATQKYGRLIDALTTGKGLDALTDQQKGDYHDLLEMGIVPYMSDERRSLFADMIFRGWKGAEKARDISEFAYKWISLQPYQEFMFGKVIPATKIAAALARRDTLIRKNGEAFRSPENEMARKREYLEINRDVEGRFGEMLYDNLFWKRWAKQVGLAIPLSLGWNLGFWRVYGDGVIDLMDNTAHMAKLNLDNKKAPGLSNRLLYMVNYTAMSMLSNAILTGIMTQTAPQLQDFFFPRIGKKANGDDERVRTPYWTGEISSLKEHFEENLYKNQTGLQAGANALTQYFGNKANPGLASIWHLVTNKDFMGRDITDRRDPWQKKLMDRVAFALKDMIEPISWQGGVDSRGIPNDTRQVIMSFLGFTQAPGWTTRTPLQNEIITMFHDQLNTHLTKHQGDIFDAKTRYQYALQAGDQRMQAEQLAQLHQLGAGQKVIEDARKFARIPPAHRAYQGLNQDNQVELLKKMSPAEYQEYWPITKAAAKMEYVRSQ